MAERSNLLTGGAPTQGVNVGSGEGVFRDKCNDITLVFKSLATTNESTLQISGTNDTIYFTSTGGGGGDIGDINPNTVLVNNTTSVAPPIDMNLSGDTVVGRLEGDNISPIGLIDVYDLSTTTKDNLSNVNNWTAKEYTGPTITDGDTGKIYIDGDYYFYFKYDNVPIRLNLA